MQFLLPGISFIYFYCKKNIVRLMIQSLASRNLNPNPSPGERGTKPTTTNGLDALFFFQHHKIPCIQCYLFIHFNILSG